MTDDPRGAVPTPLATDENCHGFCRCPVCDGNAHWSFSERLHACADRECAHQFREHNAPPLDTYEDDDDD